MVVAEVVVLLKGSRFRRKTMFFKFIEKPFISSHIKLIITKVNIDGSALGSPGHSGEVW